MGQNIQEEPSKICERQPLKILKGYGVLNFTWSILEYFVPNDTLMEPELKHQAFSNLTCCKVTLCLLRKIP